MSWRRKLFVSAMIKVGLYFFVGFILFTLIAILTFKAKKLILCGYMIYGIIIIILFSAKLIKCFFEDEKFSNKAFVDIDESKIIKKNFDNGNNLKFSIIIPTDCAFIFKNCFSSSGFLKSRADWKKLVKCVNEISIKANKNELIKLNFYEAELADGVNLPYSESLEAFIFK